MVNELGDEFELQMSETDDKLSTQQLLQVLRAITPKSLKEESWSKDMVVAYSGKQRCLINYKDRFDAEKTSKKKILHTQILPLIFIDLLRLKHGIYIEHGFQIKIGFVTGREIVTVLREWVNIMKKMTRLN